jgi:tetratricopeptide (TPR) repeat protein
MYSSKVVWRLCLLLAGLGIVAVVPDSAQAACQWKASENANNKAEKAVKDGNYNQAIAHANEAIKISPNNPMLYVTRGSAYLEKNDFDNAIADFSKMMNLDIGIECVPEEYINNYETPKDALKAYKVTTMLAAHVGRMQAYSQKGKAMSLSGNINVKGLNQLTALMEQSQMAIMLLGSEMPESKSDIAKKEAEKREKEEKLAREEAERARQEEERLAREEAERVAHEEAERVRQEQAREAAERAKQDEQRKKEARKAEILAMSVEQLVTLGISNLSNGNTKSEEFSIVREALAKHPQNTDALMMIGYIKKEMNDYKGAIETYEKVSKIDPKHVGALNQRANVYFLQKNYDQAKTLYNNALKIDSKNDAAELGLAKVAKAQGNTGEYNKRMTRVKKLAGIKKDIDEMIVEFERVLNSVPRGLSEEEKAYYEKELETRRAGYMYMLAVLYYYKFNDTKSIQTYYKATMENHDAINEDGRKKMRKVIWGF